MLGIVYTNIVDDVKSLSIEKGIEILQPSERDDWILVQTLGNDEGRE